MRTYPIALTVALLVTFTSFAQDSSKYTIALRSGSFIPARNITSTHIASLNQLTSKTSTPRFILLQFEQMPGEAEKKALAATGVDLLEYIPGNTYTATVTRGVTEGLLQGVKARAVVELLPEQKMALPLVTGNIPVAALRSPGMVDVWISYPRTISYEKVIQELGMRQMEIIPTPYDAYRIIALRVAKEKLKELAGLPFVEYVQPAPGKDIELNNKSEALSRANILQSSLAGGRNLHGEGVVVGLGDDGNLLQHIDFADRVINRAAISTGKHGTHVAGTLGGAGIVQEKFSGYAPKAMLIPQQFSNILAYAPAYIQDHNMVITNNSYGNVADDCQTFGVYDLYSRIMDEMSLAYPHLQNVFATGNSGSINCAPYPAGFHNVLGAYQSAKNVISVGAATEFGLVHPGSSRGPVADGRIKPEIMAQGIAVFSTYPPNTYGVNSGTSMAAPAVSGGLALLYQRYRQLHSNADPASGLMKALLCNGATDMGNPGPDYSYGFGQMNLLRSVKMLESNTYIESVVNAAGTNTHSITIPAGSNCTQLKVMLYWNDAPAAMLASQTLINDLDLEVVDPASATHLPYLLDTISSNVNNNATRGADHFNNIEQVVIDNPGPGTYAFRVKGTNIPLSSQYSYFLVYDTLPVSATLIYPNGGEHLAAGDSIYINWDAYGNPGNDFSLQYSTDGGASWPVTIAGNIAAGQRQFKWFIPAGSTGQAKIRLVHNGTGLESTSANFTVVGMPVITLASVQCESYIAVNWSAVADATDYEVMMLRGDEMVPVATTTATTYTFSGLSKDTVYWVSVRARINGNPGRRANAISRQPNTGTCAGTISNNDLKIDAILLPVVSGRKYTSKELSATTTIRIRIKNLDDVVTAGNIPVRYIVGAGPAVQETIINPAIAARGTYTYTFTVPADMSAIGDYPLKVSVSYPGDPVTANDTLSVLFKQLDNPVINLATDFLDDIEAAPVQSYTTRQTGLTDLDRYDFVGSTQYGRIRSFVNSGIAYSGNRALTLDADRYNAAGTTDSLTATFNLQGYNVATDDIRLDFFFKQHGQVSNAANKAWVRGSDLDPWIVAYDLFTNQEIAGVFKQSSSIELRSLLMGNAQNYSSSLQVRWGQWGQILTADNETGAGYTFDDIHLYKVTDDIQLVAIDTPAAASCGLDAAVPVKISVRNSAATAINNIPVSLQADGGTVINETIPSIPANTTITYTFAATANLAASGNHTVKTWVALPSDSYRHNDTAIVTLKNSPIISNFPYLQNFEAGDGNWYADGLRSSWQYGTPVSPRINKAASGTKAWKTRLYGNYNDAEFSYLYSPCFDISSMTNPTLSFSLALDLEDCGATLCDEAYIEYSADGKNWIKLGTMGAGTNWYNKNYSGNQVWNIQSYTRWHVATITLPTGLDRLRLRFVMHSDPYTSREGIAVDDIHIYDKQYEIYDGPPYTSNVVNQAVVNGNNWIDFTDAGKVIASINPAGQNLGSTDVQAYIYTGPIRTKHNQYYHNRNITIKPAQTMLPDSAIVRFYFTDAETELLLNAGGCTFCSKPMSAYELGVTKYNNVNKALENGSLSDNAAGDWSFISNAVKVPYDKGYYAEFRAKDFSEFWLNDGGPGHNQSLTVELMSFTATKQSNTDVKLDWITGSEFNSSYYDIELAKGNIAFIQGAFMPIGRVSSLNLPNGGSYSFTDKENNKSGIRYYRLKMADQDGGFRYSAVRSVMFDEETIWQIFPNPSGGSFYLVCQANTGENIDIRVHDINGRQVRRIQQQASGFVQKIEVNLSGTEYAKGVYLLEARAGGKLKTFRLVKL
ncbi:MAG: S8 family serine peptidase [Chitinophagaceae bacterium]